MKILSPFLDKQPGKAPGIEHDELLSAPGAVDLAAQAGVTITCVDYSPSHVSVEEPHSLEDFLDRHRPDWSAVRWIHVEGLTNLAVIHALATKYDLHPLAIEDLLHLNQRPKLEAYGGEESEIRARLFIITRALALQANPQQLDSAGQPILRLCHTQVSLFLGHKTVLTFTESGSGETVSQVWTAIHQRLKTRGSRLRASDASFLAYSLLDALVDCCFPILEYFGDRAEELETSILENATRNTLNEIHRFKRDLLLLRWAIWPMREVVSQLQRETHECVSETTRVYLSDLYDHIIQIIDIIETYREVASDLTETYMSSISNRMNEIMKVLTLIGTIFIPLTFLAGVYGMNFNYFPELNLPWAYPAFWIACGLLAVLMALFFRRKGWL